MISVNKIPTHCLFTGDHCDGSCGECFWAECPDDLNNFEPINMPLNARTKGQSGEREFCRWLESYFHLDELPERNLDQVRNGGTDIILPPFGFEVKRKEALDLDSWWIQVKNDCLMYDDKLIPVVAFRQNRKQWEFLISAEQIGNKLGYLRIKQSVFLEWSVKYRR